MGKVGRALHGHNWQGSARHKGRAYNRHKEQNAHWAHMARDCNAQLAGCQMHEGQAAKWSQRAGGMMDTKGKAVKAAKRRVLNGNSGEGLQSHCFGCDILWIAKTTSLIPIVTWASIFHGCNPMHFTHLSVATSGSTWLSTQMFIIAGRCVSA